MNYERQILNFFLDRFEKRNPNQASYRAIVFDMRKKYPGYGENLSDTQTALEAAVEHLQSWGFVECTKDVQGYYRKVTLVEPAIPQIYRYLRRTPKTDTVKMHRAKLVEAATGTKGVVNRFCMAMLSNIDEGKPIGYGLSKDMNLLEDILLVLEKLEALNTETYIRNFSELVFHDSKRLQGILSPLTNILVDFGDCSGQKETVLAEYNLINNPGYVYIKGDWLITCNGRELDVRSFEGGVAISSEALDGIEQIIVPGGMVISVENLTTYHDTRENKGAVLYLGGFMNTVRANFLKHLYECEPDAQYFHRGDLDPYGFLILENLKKRTGIPFLPLEMDLETLKLCHRAGHYRPLDDADRKALALNDLAEYQPVLQYMVDHNCKIEQECFEAMRLEQSCFV